jgi:hypothetical protein
MYRWPMTRATLLFFWGESERKKLIHERASEDCFPPQGEAFALFELSTTVISVDAIYLVSPTHGHE